MGSYTRKLLSIVLGLMLTAAGAAIVGDGMRICVPLAMAGHFRSALSEFTIGFLVFGYFLYIGQKCLLPAKSVAQLYDEQW